MSLATETPQTSQPTSGRTTLNVGTRRSKLALWQTDRAAELLRGANPGVGLSIHPMATAGDRDKTTALYAFNAKSLWTEELEVQLTGGQLDLIVHSLKDVPTQLPAGCALAAALSRSERRDAVVMGPAGRAAGLKSLADLPDGAVVGSSSVRRIAQLARLHPNLKAVDVRGNVETRLAKLDADGGPYAALILAATGLQRVGLGARVSSFLTRADDNWYGPVGQGAIGIECRSSDEQVRSMCTAVMESDSGNEGGEAARRTAGLHTWYECLAERMLLRTLEGGCSVPIGVDTVWEADDTLTMYAVVLSVDGKQVVEAKKTQKVGSREEAEACGLELAGEMVEKGAGKILEEILLNRKIIDEAGGA